jgi:hypothetical protein
LTAKGRTSLGGGFI